MKAILSLKETRKFDTKKMTSLSGWYLIPILCGIILIVHPGSSDDVILRVSKRFSDNQALDFWTSENSKTTSGIGSVIDCMSLCSANSTCWSYAYNEGNQQCTHYNTSYRVEKEPKNTAQDYYIFSDCQDGWIVLAGNCYYFKADETSDWFDAQEYCGRYGAKLAEPRSRDEYDMLAASAPRYGMYWLGGSDVITEDVWFWTRTKENLTYFVWDGNSDQPNEGTRQNCLATYLQSSAAPENWHDKECDEKLAYPICERFYIH